MIEPGAFHLERGGLAGVVPVGKDKLQTLRSVADMELRARFEREPFPLQSFQDAHFLKEPAVVGKERFADVKARETLLFQDKDPLAASGEKGGGAAAARPAADHKGVENIVCPASLKIEKPPANKPPAS